MQAAEPYATALGLDASSMPIFQDYGARRRMHIGRGWRSASNKDAIAATLRLRLESLS